MANEIQNKINKNEINEIIKEIVPEIYKNQNARNKNNDIICSYY